MNVNLDQNELSFPEPVFSTGFLPAVFVYFPLPYRDPGDRFSKTVRGYRIDLSSRIGCPYGKIGRSVLTLITTDTVKSKNPRIDLGSLRATVLKMGFTYDGQYGNQTKEQFHRFANTHVDLDREIQAPGIKGIDELHFSFADTLSLRWSTDEQHPHLPLALQKNFLELSLQCYEYVLSHAVPILLEPYFSIQSPREQDVYAWIVRRLWNLKNEYSVKWDLLYEQFGPVSRQNKPLFRTELRRYLFHIRTEIYKEARVEATDEGLILRPSPPLVEPGDKRAGHLL